MEYYQQLKKKKKDEKEKEEICIKNFEKEILNEEIKIKEIKEKIETDINLYKKEIEDLKINKLEFNISKLDYDENNKSIIIHKDKIDTQIKNYIIEKTFLEKEKKKQENEYQLKLNSIKEKKLKINLLKKKKINIEKLKTIKINEINEFKNFKILKKNKLDNLKNRKILIEDSINYILSKKLKKKNEIVIKKKIIQEEANLLKYKKERASGMKQIIDNYEKNLNSDNIIEKIKDKNDRIQSYKFETNESLFFFKNKIYILKKKLTIKNEIFKITKIEGIILLKNKFKKNLKLFENNEKLKKKKNIELEKILHDLHILKKMINTDNTKINNNLKLLILKNMNDNILIDNKIKKIRMEKENNIDNLKSIIENIKIKNKNIETENKRQNDILFTYTKEINLKKEIIHQNIQKKYKELRSNELLFKKNIDNLKKNINLKKNRVKYLENQLKD